MVPLQVKQDVVEQKAALQNHPKVLQLFCEEAHDFVYFKWVDFCTYSSSKSFNRSFLIIPRLLSFGAQSLQNYFAPPNQTKNRQLIDMCFKIRQLIDKCFVQPWLVCKGVSFSFSKFCTFCERWIESRLGMLYRSSEFERICRNSNCKTLGPL